ncbi:hypothetical protein BH23PLA1_BH23PLA1_06350 [soil metagenome]
MLLNLRASLLVLLSGLVLGPTARSSSPIPPAVAESARQEAALPSGPSFDALLTDGSTVSGPILRFGPEDQVVLAVEGQEQAIPYDQLVKLSRPGMTVPFPPSGALLLLADGDRLKALINSADEDALLVTSEILGELEVPLEAASGLILSPPTETERQLDLLLQVQQEARAADLLWLTNNDRRSGTFLGMDSRRISFQSGANPIEIPRGDIRAIGLDPALTNYPTPEGPYLELTLSDGSRIGAHNPSIDQGELVAQTRFGAEVRVPIRDLARVHLLGGSVTYLSDREPAGDQYVSYIGPTRPYQRDASVLGRPIRIAGEHYDRGLGTQSRSLLAYRLGPEDRRFQALVGLDDRAGPLGNVEFKVIVDGQEQFASPPMTVDDDPIAINVNVSEARLLILITEFGLRGGIRDYADWAEARLVR